MIEDPIRHFEEEHEAALAALARLETAAQLLHSGQRVDQHLATVVEVLELLRGEVRRHNEDEEATLFPLLETEAPLAPFVAEHVVLRRLETELSAALARRDSAAVLRGALDIVQLLRAHIERENKVLFPMARSLLGPQGMAEVARRLALRVTAA